MAHGPLRFDSPRFPGDVAGAGVSPLGAVPKSPDPAGATLARTPGGHPGQAPLK